MLMRVVMLPAALLFSSSVLAQTMFPDRCPGGAKLPFSAIEVKHPIDSTCPALTGGKNSSLRSQAQNKVKNNFCASAATPEETTPQQLILLQGTAFATDDIKAQTGQGLEPTDRAALTGLGEGKLVRMKGFLIEAHYADIAPLKGESVNCNRRTPEDNDIHIAFGPDAGTMECAGVSAEIIPHYRPASWAEIGNFQAFDTKSKKYIVNKQLAARLQAQPYRITGQRFYDASHVPCPCGTGCSPSRSSDWEIHPVYKIEVCSAPPACDENNDKDWTDFDTWWKASPAPKPASPQPAKAPPAGHANKKPSTGSV